MNGAVFLDRDGTLIEETGYLDKPEEVQVFPGAVEALKQLAQAGFGLFIVTNQSGIGRGYYTEDDMHAVNRRLCDDLEREGVRFREIFFAPEAPGQPSRGRKPSPQFLFDARDRFGVNLAESYMVGDKRSDLECGWNAGVRLVILVRTGYGCKHEPALANSMQPFVAVDNLGGATRLILNDRSQGGCREVKNLGP